jgi:hypothetical protein
MDGNIAHHVHKTSELESGSKALFEREQIGCPLEQGKALDFNCRRDS